MNPIYKTKNMGNGVFWNAFVKWEFSKQGITVASCKFGKLPYLNLLDSSLVELVVPPLEGVHVLLYRSRAKHASASPVDLGESPA